MSVVRDLAERAYFGACLAFARLIRAGKYSKVWMIARGAERRVRKHRRPYAPLLIWFSKPLVAVLDAGVRVLPQREWEAREREMYRALYGVSIDVAPTGAVLLPLLAEHSLATLLEDRSLNDATKRAAIHHAAVALASFHSHGFTHGDAMAENVVVDLDAGVARWIDFETVHDPGRDIAWRRADDVRALAVSCLFRTASEQQPETLARILHAYGDEAVTPLVAATFVPIWRRSLTVHLSQAPVSFQSFRDISLLLRARVTQ